MLSWEVALKEVSCHNCQGQENKRKLDSKQAGQQTSRLVLEEFINVHHRDIISEAGYCSHPSELLYLLFTLLKSLPHPLLPAEHSLF